MFPFQRSCELSFQNSNIKPDDEQYNNSDIIKHDLFISDFAFDSLGQNSNINTFTISTPNDHPSNNKNGSSTGRRGGRRPWLSAAGSSSGDGACLDGSDKKRVMHREIERQRRQEMASLFSSLRDLLPVDSVQGKRSTSDHIMEAATYISRLKRNVKELKEKRDNLKAMEEEEDMAMGEPGSSRCSSGETVIVNVERFSLGLEIKISTAFDHRDEANGFPLSRLLAVILEQGLEVNSCVSTRVKRRWIHVIHTEVDGTDPHQLRQRLLDEIHLFHDP